MAGIPGRLLGLQIGGVFISCETSCSFNCSKDMLPASAIDSAGWKEFISGIKTWTMSVDGQLLAESAGADFKTILNDMFNDIPVLATIGTRPSATTQLTISGLALASQTGFTGPSKGKASWTANFQGTGKLTTNFEDFSLIIDSMPPESDYPIIFDLRVT